MRTFGLDTQSIDETPDADNRGLDYPVHRMIADAGGVIIENLRALEQIDFADPLITAFPLRLTGADGSPVRAVAIELVP